LSELLDKLDAIRVGSLSLSSLLSAALVFLLCLALIKVLKRFTGKLLKRSKLEPGLKGFIQSAVSVLLWCLAIIMVADSLGVKTTSLVAALSVAGLALSLSVQGSMSNLFAGITLLTVRPFVIGDFVELSSISGTVRSVGLFYTVLCTVDNKAVFVPNSEVTSAKLINYSRETTRRVDLLFCADYGDPTDKVKSALLEAAAADARILRDPAPFAGIHAYKDSAVEYTLRVWVGASDYLGVYFGLNESVRETFAKRGVTMSYRHVNVHMVREAEK
jgi:small conductance mechanosensitive channel